MAPPADTGVEAEAAAGATNLRNREPVLEPCWEYFHCEKDACTMFGRTAVPCWTVEGTLCNNLTRAHCRPAAGNTSKREACERCHCIYLEACKSWPRDH